MHTDLKPRFVKPDFIRLPPMDCFQMQICSRCPQRIGWAGFCTSWLLLTLLSLNWCAAQTIDTVFIRRTDSEPITKRSGTIVDWVGDSLTLSSNDRDKQIPNTDIVEIRTTWPAEYLAGQTALNAGNLTHAIEQLQTAVKTEQRAWANRIIRSELIRAYAANENYDAAIQQFLTIYGEDRQTRFFHLCPLQWFTTNRAPTDIARTLLNSRDPVEQLIAASWLLAGTDRDAATKILDQLSTDIDARIQHLARAQLWRLRSLNRTAVNARLIEVWEQQTGEMPASLQAGPWFVIAAAQTTLKQSDAAAVNFLRIPILYSEHAGLAAASLYQARQLFVAAGDNAAGETIKAELQQKYPQSIWAKD